MSDTSKPDTTSIPTHVREDAITYEQMLARDLRWAMDEGSRHFERGNAVHETLRRICRRLNRMDVPYAVVGGMALFKYGYRRFTEDVDILVTPKSLTRIHKELDGLGYCPPFSGSKHLRDTECKVKIEFLVTGEFPGDGKPNEVAFPDPRDVSEVEDGISYLSLTALVELKIASGLTGTDRMKDLVDIQELIRVLSLPRSFSEGLSPYVQAKYLELWQASNSGTVRYMKLWQNYFLTTDAASLDETIDDLESALALFKAMRADGVAMDVKGGAKGPIYLFTTDAEIAKKYDMHDEREFLGNSSQDEDS